MAAYNKFHVFTTDITNKVHDFDADVFKWVFTNTAPVATNALYSDISATELANGSGYTTGGLATGTITVANTSGVRKVTLPAVTLTATGAVGPFRYQVLVNTTPTSPLKPLVMWYDYGSSVTMANTETFTLTPDASGGLFTIT